MSTMPRRPKLNYLEGPFLDGDHHVTSYVVTSHRSLKVVQHGMLSPGQSRIRLCDLCQWQQETLQQNWHIPPIETQRKRLILGAIEERSQLPEDL
ncbi:hypothetical protein VNO77_34207 [Canavalia gladiata]|uniref:Uncharacterized protein n=1 Tax=Canavalia gladiata TaxID=3824 RepID=A0AAN9KFT2_CANGL